MPVTEERPRNTAHDKIGFTEFVILAAATMSTQAIAIDAILPAFPVIVQALQVDNPNHGQWLVTTYMAGLGCGQLFWGLMSDRFGRRRILIGGLSLYVIAALICSLAGSFQTLLAWRFVHGLAAACVTVTRSVIRDLYSGRDMARVMSLTFVVFLMVPMLAPSLGQGILLLAPWRYIFVVFACFAAVVATWGFLRLPETLHPEYRLALDFKSISSAAKLVLGTRSSMFYTLAMTVMFGSLMAYVAMVQQICRRCGPSCELDAQHVCAVRDIHGHGGVSQFAHRATLGHAAHFPHRVAGVHCCDGFAHADRRFGLGDHVDLRGFPGRHDGLLQLVRLQFRCDGHGTHGRSRRHCGVGAGIHFDFRGCVARGLHRTHV